jgi:hypothetical protein
MEIAKTDGLDMPLMTPSQTAMICKTRYIVKVSTWTQFVLVGWMMQIPNFRSGILVNISSTL